MFRMLLRLLSVKLLAGSAKRRLRRYAVAGALLLAAGLCGLAAGIILLVALYQWLLTQWPPPLAALGTAALPAVLGAVLVFVARQQLDRKPARPAADDDSSEATPVAAADTRLAPLFPKSQRKQAGILAAALVVGIVVGLFHKRG